MKKLDMEKVRPLIKLAIEEDLGQGDITSELLFSDDIIEKANIVSREEIVVCGMEIIREILKLYDKRIKLKVLAEFS
jgi:nicotinate-nucleotide pyrophosphorylase (carboxylating)